MLEEEEEGGGGGGGGGEEEEEEEAEEEEEEAVAGVNQRSHLDHTLSGRLVRALSECDVINGRKPNTCNIHHQAREHVSASALSCAGWRLD